MNGLVLIALTLGGVTYSIKEGWDMVLDALQVESQGYNPDIVEEVKDGIFVILVVTLPFLALGVAWLAG